MLRQKEGAIQLQIIHYLKRIGAVVGKTKTMGVRYGKMFRYDPYLFIGFSDLVAFHKKRIFFIEVKSKTGTQTPEQKIFQNYVEEAGLTYILARSVEDVAKIIK